MSVLLFLLCACSATLAVPTAEYYALEEAELHFERFIQEYDKNYIDENEKQVRFQIFKDNLEEVNRMNEKSNHAVFGITKFMDLTDEEFASTYTSPSPVSDSIVFACPLLHDKNVPDMNAPESHDWREHNAVTRIKEQKKCGSCYAFSAIGIVESQHAIKHKQLIELSEQQVVDCDTLNYGCNGGFVSAALTTLKESIGVATEDSYPYTGVKGQCSLNQSNTATVQVVSCNTYNLTSQEKLKQLVYGVGPISVVVESRGFKHYKRGVLPDEVCREFLRIHAVIIVGYGIEDGIPYWLIKNSWGTNAGDKGYVKVQRGEGVESCGLMNADMASVEVE